MLRSATVFIDAGLGSFDAPKPFPNTSEIVTLDANLALETV